MSHEPRRDVDADGAPCSNGGTWTRAGSRPATSCFETRSSTTPISSNPWLGFTRTVSLFFYTMIYGYRLIPAAYKLLPSPREDDPAGFSFARLILAGVCSWITSNKFSQWQSKTLDYLRPSKSSSSSVVRCYAFAPNWQHRARKCFGIPRDLAFPAIKYIRPMLLYL